MSKDSTKKDAEAKKAPSKKALEQPIIDKPKQQNLPWGGLTAVGLLLLTFILSSAVGYLYEWLYVSVFHNWTTAQISAWENNSVVGQFFSSVIVYAVWIALTVLFIPCYGLLIGKGLKYIKKWRSIFNTIGWQKPKWRDLAYALAGFGVYFGAYVLAITVISHVFPSFNPNQSQDVGFSGGVHGKALILVFISLVILPPVVEETIFRGFLYTGLRNSMPVVWAGLITSIFFAAPHVLEGTGGTILLVGGVDTFILSCVQVFLRQKSGSLWSPIGLHMIKNGIAFASLFIFARILL